MYLNNNAHLNEFRLEPGATNNVPKRSRNKRKDPFLKGPIDWRWLCSAALLPGRALHVAVALQYLAGLHRLQMIQLSVRPLTELGLTRTTRYRALKALEEAGLVHVCRGNGKLPVVTILQCPATTEGAADPNGGVCAAD